MSMMEGFRNLFDKPYSFEAALISFAIDRKLPIAATSDKSNGLRAIGAASDTLGGIGLTAMFARSCYLESRAV